MAPNNRWHYRIGGGGGGGVEEAQGLCSQLSSIILIVILS